MIKYAASEAFFESKYRASPDPWDFASAAYELAKYDAIVDSLHHRYFRRAFEPGCSIGVLTEKLAPLCKQVDGLEISATAAGRAGQRCRALINVQVKHGSLPNDMPKHSYDLIVFSDIGYYFSSRDLADLIAELALRLTRGGLLCGAHWLGESEDHELSGDQVHAIVNANPALHHSRSERRPGFRLDHWIKI